MTESPKSAITNFKWLVIPVIACAIVFGTPSIYKSIALSFSSVYNQLSKASIGSQELLFKSDYRTFLDKVADSGTGAVDVGSTTLQSGTILSHIYSLFVNIIVILHSLYESFAPFLLQISLLIAPFAIGIYPFWKTALYAWIGMLLASLLFAPISSVALAVIGTSGILADAANWLASGNIILSLISLVLVSSFFSTVMLVHGAIFGCQVFKVPSLILSILTFLFGGMQILAQHIAMSKALFKKRYYE